MLVPRHRQGYPVAKLLGCVLPGESRSYTERMDGFVLVATSAQAKRSSHLRAVRVICVSLVELHNLVAVRLAVAGRIRGRGSIPVATIEASLQCRLQPRSGALCGEQAVEGAFVRMLLF